MDLPEVNILVNAFRSDLPGHSVCRDWIEEKISSDSRFAMSPLVLSGFVRIVTNKKIFVNPNSSKEALGFADAILDQENCVSVNPSDRHWGIFSNLCKDMSVVGNLVPDAYFAAIAIEHSCRWITLDRDFKMFKELNYKLLKEPKPIRPSIR